MTINLTTPLTLTPAVIVTSVTIDRIVDVPQRRRVVASVRETPSPLVLWENEAYDAIGDWTQAQAEARILELLG